MTAPHPLATLAATARATANAARDGSDERRAAGCVAVVLSTCRTLTAARRALEAVRPESVRDGALDYLAGLIDAGPSSSGAGSPGTTGKGHATTTIDVRT